MSDRAEGTDPERLRLFLAFDLPEEHGAEIRSRTGRLRPKLPAARWVPVDNLHLTLAFLGATEADRVPGLTDAVAPAFASVAPLDLTLAGGGTFPPNRPARIAWVGIGGPPELLAVQRRVAEAATGHLGLEAERRPFHPHVTVARPRRPWSRRPAERFAGAFEGRVGEPFTITEGVLYRSDLGPGGARYSALDRFPLASSAESPPPEDRDPGCEP